MSQQKLVHLSKNSFFQEVNQRESEQPLALEYLEDMKIIPDNFSGPFMSTTYMYTPKGDAHPYD